MGPAMQRLQRLRQVCLKTKQPAQRADADSRREVRSLISPVRAGPWELLLIESLSFPFFLEGNHLLGDAVAL